MIKVYKKQPIQAEQFDEVKWQSVYNDSHNPEEWDFEARKLGIDHYHGYFIIPTHEGDMRVHDGDWIATGVNGEHWPISDDVFRKTYAELPVIPKGVARWIELTKQAGKSLGDMFVDYTPEQLTDADEDMISDWVGDNKNQTILANTLARAWLDGYQVEAQHDTRTD